MPLWTKRYNGTGNGDDYAVAIAVDKNGNVFTTGYSTNGSGGYAYATVAYSSAGTSLWTNRYSGAAQDVNRATALAVDGSGNVFVTGYALSMSGGLNYSLVTVAYSGAGAALWTNSYRMFFFSPTTDAQATALAVDTSGNVVVTGYGGMGNHGAVGYVTIKYSAYVPSVHLDLLYLENQLVLNWTNAAFGLQSAPTITGTFTNLPGATTPYTNPISGAQQFFRLISN